MRFFPFQLRYSAEISAFLLFCLLIFGSVWLLTYVQVALTATITLFIALTLAGYWLSSHTARVLNDQRLSILGTFWVIKVSLTILLLYAGWIPDLDPLSSQRWGHDPQRYFQDAPRLIENDWRPSVVNYQGIIFYYAGIFYLFGHNPVIPALINAFVTLLGTLFLIRCAYSLVQERTPKDWTIAFLLLVPEVLWYDVMTSRETLMAVLIIVATLATGRLMVGADYKSRLHAFILILTMMLAILAVRTSMILPVFGCLVIMSVVLRGRNGSGRILKVVLVACSFVVLMLGPNVQQLMGGYDIDYLAGIERVQSFEKNIASEMEWREKSIGLLLAPNSLWQSIVLLPPRMLLYLAAPLPIISVSLDDLIDGNRITWEMLMTIPTAVITLLGFPYVLAATLQAWRQRKSHSPALVLPIVFWSIFAAVAGGNIIIHERYRVMSSLLMFATMWWGFTRCRRIDVQSIAYVWFFLLGIGALFSIGYKIL